MTEHRYEERGHNFTLESFGPAGKVTLKGPIKDRPEWLTNIVSLAKVGGYLEEVFIKPPDRILWFETSDDGELVEMTKFTNDADMAQMKLKGV